MFDDIDGPEQIGELAASLIPSPDPENMVFTESARDLLDAIISHLKEDKGMVSLPGVLEYISSFDTHKELLTDLRGSSSEDAQNLATGLKQSATNERLLGSIFAVFRSNLRFLRYPAIRESLKHSDFSLSELSGKKVGIFLQFEESTKELTGKLSSVLIAHLFRYLIVHTNRDPVFLLLDEIGNMPVIQGLKEKLNTIRSRNLPTWMFWQSKEQMQLYGEKSDEGPNIIMGACDVQMFFRLNDNATAEWVSEKIGTVDKVVDKRSSSPGFMNHNYSQDIVREAVIFPHELQRLGDGEVVCTYRGKAWRGTATPYFNKWPEYQGNKPLQEECLGMAY